MKQITFLTLLVILLMSAITNLSAQFGDNSAATEEVEERALPSPSEINLFGTRVYNDQFKTDGLNMDGKIGLFNNIPFNWTDSWQNAVLSLGPMAAFRVNSGILNNQEFAERIMRISGGVFALVSFPASVLIVEVEAGNHSTDYTLKSGYTEHRDKFFMAAKFAFHQYQGRLQDQIFFPTWNVVISAGFPWNDQQVFSWGYEAFQPRQNEAGQNLNSLHGLFELGLIDIAFSESFKVCLKARGLGGKYNNDIMYFGGGTGIDFVFNNVTAFYFNADKIWGWSNSKFNNIQVNIGLSYSFFEKIYDETY